MLGIGVGKYGLNRMVLDILNHQFSFEKITVLEWEKLYKWLCDYTELTEKDLRDILKNKDGDALYEAVYNYVCGYMSSRPANELAIIHIGSDAKNDILEISMVGKDGRTYKFKVNKDQSDWLKYVVSQEKQAV